MNQEPIEQEVLRLADTWATILAQDLGYVFGHSLIAEKHAFFVSQSVGQDGYTFLADHLRHV